MSKLAVGKKWACNNKAQLRHRLRRHLRAIIDTTRSRDASLFAHELISSAARFTCGEHSRKSIDQEGYLGRWRNFSQKAGAGEFGERVSHGLLGNIILRDLDKTNPSMARPNRFVSFGAVLPMAFSVFSVPLAINGAPGIPLTANPILGVLILVLGFSAYMLLVPCMCRWNWEAKYFGVTLFHVSSVSLICLVPWLCIVMYSQLSFATRVGVFLVGAGLHVAWCIRFIRLYRTVIRDGSMQALIYQEEDDAVYYMQTTDKQFLEKRFRFNQVPQDRYFVICSLLTLPLLLMMREVSVIVGLPFIHVLLLIGSFPVSLMGAGFATRGWLIFYYYPMQIKKRTGKRVYVDMAGRAARY